MTTAKPYILLVQGVIETENYLRDACSAGLGKIERNAIVEFAARNPASGDVIPGTGGARKIRFAGRGKGDRVDLTQSERNQMRLGLRELAKKYRGIAT
jgi:hypothetical protein